MTAADVRPRSLLARDFKSGQLPRGAAGPQGAQGPKGDTGPRGPAGTDATVNGVPAGGDLTGTFPAPSIANGAVTAGKVASNSLTGAQIDESSLAAVPDAAALGGLAASSFEQPHMGQLSLSASSSVAEDGITTVGGMGVYGTCVNNFAPLNDGAGVTVRSAISGQSAQVWEEHGGTAEYQPLPNNGSDFGSFSGLVATAPQVFTYEGVDGAGKLFHITAASRYEGGTCTFVAWGSSHP